MLVPFSFFVVPVERGAFGLFDVGAETFKDGQALKITRFGRVATWSL